MSRVTIIGAGNWGTALAQIAATRGHTTRLWARDPVVTEAINTTHCNPRYLSEIKLDRRITATSDLLAAIRGAGIVILAAPAQTARTILHEVAGVVDKSVLLVCAAKGLEVGTGLRISEIALEAFDQRFAPRFVCLTGPSFAKEVIRGNPTAVLATSSSLEDARIVQSELSSSTLRIYASTDLTGAEICGALKNVMAIAAGMVAGLGFGSNTIAALITRGLAEITRYSLAFGGRRETTVGLAGLGDLTLTCTGLLSRNRFVGYELGLGRGLKEIVAGMNEVAEGVETTRALRERALISGIEMPITEAVYSVLYDNATPRQAINELMNRPLKDED